MSNAITAMQGLTTDEAPTRDLTLNVFSGVLWACLRRRFLGSEYLWWTCSLECVLTDSNVHEGFSFCWVSSVEGCP